MRGRQTTGDTEDAVEAPRPDRGRRTTVLLILGVLVGALVAAVGLMAPGANQSSSLAGNWVARVNGETIRREDYERVLSGLASDRRGPLTDEDRQHLLDRLIEEELLVQRGMELGLARKDRRVRGDITSAMIASIIAEVDTSEPSEAALQEFYDQHRDFFVQPGRLRVRQIFLRVPDQNDESQVLQRAAQAATRLREGADFAVVAAALGDPPPVPLPDDLLPAAKLRDYLGPTAVRTAMGLAAGEVSEPVRSGSGIQVLQLVDRQPDFVPPLASIRDDVVQDFRRRSEDDALRAYLNRLRDRAEVIVAAPP